MTGKFGPFTLNRHQRTGVLQHVPMGDTIPKLIHQTFRTRALPPEIEANIAKLRADNPGWQHRLYDDDAVEAFIAAEYGPRMLSYYKRISPSYGASKADFFRYLVVYRLGGVYLDIKSTALRPLDQIIQPDDKFILSFWDPSDPHTLEWGINAELDPAGGLEYQQWYVIGVPGHPFLARVIENALYNLEYYVPELHGTGFLSGMRVTGPYAYTLGIGQVLHRYPHRLETDLDRLGLQYSIYGDSIRHRQTLGGHYRQHTSSHTIPTLFGRLASLVARLVVTTRNRFRGRADVNPTTGQSPARYNPQPE